jgi:hypothetical protein
MDAMIWGPEDDGWAPRVGATTFMWSWIRWGFALQLRVVARRVSTVHGPTFLRVQGRASENGTWNAGAVGPWTAPMQSPRVRDATMTVSVPFTGRVAYRTSVLRRNCRQEYSSLSGFIQVQLILVFSPCVVK